MIKLPDTKGKKVTNLILLALEKAVDGYVRFEDFTYHHYRYMYGCTELKKASLSKALQRLREEGSIELVDDEKLIYRLTDRGREKAVLAELQSLGGQWDGKWRVLIFDIPEKRKKAAREALRSKLIDLNFFQLQKSVWIHPYPCENEIQLTAEIFGVTRFINIIIANKILNDVKAKIHFGLL